MLEANALAYFGSRKMFYAIATWTNKAGANLCLS
jgi:hypothetical protein